MIPAMKILGALVSVSSPTLTDIVIAAGSLKALKGVLSDAKGTAQLRRDAAWTLSNVAAGRAAQAQKLLDERGLFEALRTAVESESVHQVRRECFFVLANLAKQGAPVLSHIDCRELLRLLAVALGAATEPAVQSALLHAVEVTLRNGADQAVSKGLSENPLVACAEEVCLLEVLEELQQSESESVYRKAMQILEKFFNADSENEPPEERGRENEPPEPTTPSAAQRPATICKSPNTPSAILMGSPARPGYKFGA